MEETIKRSFKKLIHWQYFPLLVLLLVILGLHLATITRPDALLFDEHHYITDARRILTGEGTDRTEHPPLAKLLIVGGVELFGDNQWGWRLPSVLISTVALIAFYDICRKLGTSHKTAFIATMLLGLDNLMFIHSGIAMLDIYLVAFTIFAFWSYLKGQRWWWLSAVFIGLAGLCKFSGALAVIPIGLHWFISYMSNTVPRTKNPPSALSEASVVDTPESVHTEEYPAIETGVAASATTDSEQSADTYITTVQSTNSVQIAETSTRSTSSAPLAEETAQASSAEAVRPSFWKTYSNPIIFFASMILAPVTFFLFYGILDMIIWGKWIPFVVWGHWDEGVLGTIRRALNSTNSIKFAYGGAFPSRPWEWLLSPSGSLYFYGALFRPENYKDIALAYWFKPSYTGMINPSIWLGGLMTIPYVIWKSLKRSNAAIFAMCWIIGTWGVWIPMFLLTTRITYMFYYLPTIGAVAIGLALILTSWLNKAQSSSGRKGQHLIKLVTVSFLLVHLLSFCILSPIQLWISVPVCALLLIFTMGYLGFGKRFNIQFCIAACISAVIMRFGLYWMLNKWLVTDIAPWGLPDVSLLWVISTLIGLALAWGLFAIINRIYSIIAISLTDVSPPVDGIDHTNDTSSTEPPVATHS